MSSTLRAYRYRLVNVFAETPLAGNALCVFEDARGLDDETMQGLALQFNLSETTFVLPSATATAHVRIFTPTFELPFAGHPTLGTAHVVRSALGAPDALTLEMRAGIIPVSANGDVWTLRAQAPKVRPVAIDRTQIAQALQLAPSDIASDPLWIDTGAEQMIVPLLSIEAVRRAKPDAATIADWPLNNLGRAMCYVWAYATPQTVESRFFFTKHGTILEDPGTGSACANLGGWMLSSGQMLPFSVNVAQGAAVGRPCRLGLSLTSAGEIMVSGNIIELGAGVINLP